MGFILAYKGLNEISAIVERAILMLSLGGPGGKYPTRILITLMVSLGVLLSYVRKMLGKYVKWDSGHCFLHYPSFGVSGRDT